jgi:hypothetical protein
MVHALQEAQRVLKPNGILLDVRPAARHRRAGLGEGRGWRQVGVMREVFDDDIAADRAVKQVIRDGLFKREARAEFDLDRVMDNLQDFRTWLNDFDPDKLPSHDWLYAKVERAAAKAPAGTKITVRGPLKIGVLRKIDSLTTGKRS